MSDNKLREYVREKMHKLDVEADLNRLGLNVTRKQFERVVEATFNKYLGHWTDDYLFQNPIVAVVFDNVVKKALGLPCLPDRLVADLCRLAPEHGLADVVINKTLINIRKRAASKHRRSVEAGGLYQEG